MSRVAKGIPVDCRGRFARNYTEIPRVLNRKACDALPVLEDVCEAEVMVCPSCNQRKARRACPALGQTICTVCCGTKRLREIQCPKDCVYLSSAREHPAAVVRRQQERDVAFLLPSIAHLTERQRELFFVFHTVIARYSPEGFGRLSDDDVAEAAGALAATLETAARGVIYEHSPQSPIAQGLVRSMKAILEEIRSQGSKIYDGETAIALRAIEQGVRDLQKAGAGADSGGYLAMVARLLHFDRQPPDPPAESAEVRSIVLP